MKAQLVDLSRLSIEEALSLQAKRYATRLAGGHVPTPIPTAAAAPAGVSCASCGQNAASQRNSSSGPWHCAACWGEGPFASDQPTVVPSWWAIHSSAWFRALVDGKKLREETRTIAGVQRVCIVTDPGNDHFPSVGAEKMWPAAERLCQYLIERETRGGRAVIGTTVELGAGCGVPGVLLAHRGSRTYLTDLPWLLPLTELNVAANFEADDPQRPVVAALRWGCQADLTALPSAPELVIGSDVVYRKEHVPGLLDTLSALDGATTVLSVQHRGSAGSHDVGILAFFQQSAVAAGWRVEPAMDFCCSRCSILVLSRAPPDPSAVALRREVERLRAEAPSRAAVRAAAKSVMVAAGVAAAFRAAVSVAIEVGEAEAGAVPVVWGGESDVDCSVLRHRLSR